MTLLVRRDRHEDAGSRLTACRSRSRRGGKFEDAARVATSQPCSVLWVRPERLLLALLSRTETDGERQQRAGYGAFAEPSRNGRSLRSLAVVQLGTWRLVWTTSFRLLKTPELCEKTGIPFFAPQSTCQGPPPEARERRSSASGPRTRSGEPFAPPPRRFSPYAHRSRRSPVIPRAAGRRSAARSRQGRSDRRIYARYCVGRQRAK